MKKINISSLEKSYNEWKHTENFDFENPDVLDFISFVKKKTNKK